MKKLTIIIVAFILASSAIFAQDEQTEIELAKKAQDPIANMITFPIQNIFTL